MTPRATRTLALALLLPLVGAVELALTFVQAAPQPSEYTSLVEPVRGMRHDGDRVVVAPRWAEPHVRAVLGDEALTLEDLASSDNASVGRAIEISVEGQRAPELSEFREVSRTDVGPFVVRELQNPAPELVIYDFLDHLGPAHASASGTEPPTTCRWTDRAPIETGGLGGHPTFPRRRFECPEGEFLGVGVTVIADEEFLPRRCIWAHPPHAGARIVRFSGVPLGNRIVGHSGMYWIIERTKRGAPVELVVRVDGDTIGRVTHRDGEGWDRFELPLGVHQGKPAAEVEFAIQSANNLHRHFCFEASVR